MIAKITDPGRSLSHLLKAAVLAVAVGAGFQGETAYAGIAGEQIVIGDVTFIHDGNRTIIQASDGSIINYLSFDVLPWETIQFVQPSQWSRVLNRITGPDPTVMAGRLLSNGQVYIINPAGVYFAGGSVVDVGALYAAAGNLSDQDFTSHVDRFTGLTGDVVNSGAIAAGDVNLVGRHVANHGSITSNGGLITMVAGDQVYISRLGERITVIVDGAEITNQERPHGGTTTPDMLATPGVENTGVIHNAGGSVVFGAGDLYALAIRNTGTVEAAGGNITLGAVDGLVQNDGLLSASVDHGQAGSVVVQGPSVLNRGQIRADANDGSAGYVELTSRNHTYLTPGSVVSAAGGSGFAHAGEVLVHSYEGQTIFPRGATLDISGGLQGGYGGFGEVSGRYLIYAGSTLMGASNGYGAGSLLIDPADILIDETGPFDPLPAGGTINFGDPPVGGMTHLQASALNGNINFAATNSIIVNAAVNLGGGTLVFTANGFIRIGSTVTAQSTTLNAPTIFLRDATVTTVGDQVYNGNVLVETLMGDLVTDLTSTAGTVRFMQTLDSNGTIAQPSGVRITGNASFMGNVGTTFGLLSLEVNGQSAFANGVSTVRTTNFQRYLGPVTIGSNLTMQSLANQEIRFAGTLDAAALGVPPNLTINTSGATRFEGVVGGVLPLGTINTIGGGTTFVGANMSAIGLDFDDAVTLTANSVMNGTGFVDFASTVGGGGFDLTINSPTTGFNGNVTNMGTLTTDMNGTTTLNAGLVQGQNIAFNDTLALGQNATLTGAATVGLGVVTGGGNDLTVNSPMTAFNGNVTNVGTLTTDAGAGHQTTIAADITGQTLDFNDTVILGGNSILTGMTSIDFASMIAGAGFDLTLNGPMTVLNANVLNVGNLTTGGGGFTRINGTGIGTTVQATNMTFNDAVQLSGIVLVGTAPGSVNSVVFNQTVTGVNPNARLTVLGANRTFNGTVSGLQNLTSLAEAGSITNLNADIQNVAIVRLQNMTSLGGPGGLRTIAGTNEITLGPLAGNGLSLTLDTGAAGITQINGAIAGVNVLTTDADGTTTVSANVAGQTLDFNDALTLGANVMLTGTTSVDFAQAIAGGGNDLTVLSPLTAFNGNVANVGTLVTDAAGTTTLNAASIQAQVISLQDAVALGLGATLTGNTSLSLLGGLAGNGFDLTLASPTTLITGNVAGVNVFTTDAAGATRISNANVQAQTVDINDALIVDGTVLVEGLQLVDFASTIDSLLGATANLTVNSNQLVNFRGDIGVQPGQALVSLAVNSGAGLADQNTIVFHGNRTVQTNGGDILLNAGGRGAPSQVASIAGNGSLTLRATAGGNVLMGQNEKLTALGNLRIEALNGTATLGDLNSGGNIDVLASAIQLRLRGGASLLTAAGQTISDTGLDLVALGSLNFSAAPTFIGSGLPVVVAAGGGATIAGVTVRPLSAVGSLLLVDGSGRILDLRVPATDITNLAEALDGELAQLDSRLLSDPITQRSLQDLGFAIRTQLTADELATLAEGVAIYRDLPATGVRRSGEIGTLANRLDRRIVLRVLDRYADLFLDQRTDPDTGEVVVEKRDDVVRSAIADAWSEYTASGSPQGFREWLEQTGEHADALAYLNDLRALLRDVEQMGATRREQLVCMSGMMTRVKPGDMDAGTLAEAIGADTSG